MPFKQPAESWLVKLSGRPFYFCHIPCFLLASQQVQKPMALSRWLCFRDTEACWSVRTVGILEKMFAWEDFRFHESFFPRNRYLSTDFQFGFTHIDVSMDVSAQFWGMKPLELFCQSTYVKNWWYILEMEASREKIITVPMRDMKNTWYTPKSFIWNYRASRCPSDKKNIMFQTVNFPCRFLPPHPFLSFLFLPQRFALLGCQEELLEPDAEPARQLSSHSNLSEARSNWNIMILTSYDMI